MSNGCYLYRYMSDSVPVYVGIADDLDRRHKQHQKDAWFNEGLELDYIKLRTRSDAELLEMFFVKAYENPSLRNVAMRGSKLTLKIGMDYEDAWIEYATGMLSCKHPSFTKTPQPRVLKISEIIDNPNEVYVEDRDWVVTAGVFDRIHEGEVWFNDTGVVKSETGKVLRNVSRGCHAFTLKDLGIWWRVWNAPQPWRKIKKTAYEDQSREANEFLDGFDLGKYRRLEDTVEGEVVYCVNTKKQIKEVTIRENYGDMIVTSEDDWEAMYDGHGNCSTKRGKRIFLRREEAEKYIKAPKRGYVT